MKSTKKFQKRPQYYWIEKIYTELAVLFFPILDKTPIMPNMITVLNMLNGLYTFYAVWSKQYALAAILIQVYLFLDIVDGNLARYKNMTSELGKNLDLVCDIVFYNLFFILLGVSIGIHWLWIVLYEIIFNLYGWTATNVIVPRIRKLKEFKRRGLKKYLFDHGIILGMETGMQDVLTTILLFTPYKHWIFYSIIILYCLDLLYRFYELRYNEMAEANR